MHHNYEKLTVYQDSLSLAKTIYRLTKGLKCFVLVDQITGSNISIPSNIAEGSQRSSKRDFLKFLSYSKGSSAELLTQLRILQEEAEVKDQNYLATIISDCEVLNSRLHAFINHINKTS